MRLNNKVIIVTGSCTGIGKAIALRCVAEGASVVVHGLEQDLGEAVINEIEKDKAVLPETVKGVGEMIDAPFEEFRIPTAAHWVQQEAGDAVTEILREFLAE